MDFSPAVSGSNWIFEHSKWFERSTESCFGLGRVYVACMESRIEHVREFLEKNGILGKVSILRAFTPDGVDMEDLIESGVLSPRFSKQGGGNKYARSVCCSLSHIACWVDAQRSKACPVLVLEDDLAHADERESVSKLFAAADSYSWDLLYLSYCYAAQRSSQLLTDELVALRGQLCANAYAISAAALDSLLSSAFPIEVISDEYMRNHAEANDFLALGSTTLLFQQDRSAVPSSFGEMRSVPAPAWSPEKRQKLISAVHSALTFSGSVGYDRAIWILDCHRQGKLKGQARKHIVVRVWDALERINILRRTS